MTTPGQPSGVDRLGDANRRAERHALDTLFEPQSIALVGVSRDPTKIGSRVVANLRARGYGGDVVGIHPREEQLGGMRCVRSVGDLDAPPDLAFITLPAAAAVAAAAECVEAGVGAIVVAANGFAESGTSEGAALEHGLRELARASGTRILGPNTNGFYNAVHDLALGYNGAHAFDLRSGPLHLISHSGALFSILASRAKDAGIGIGLFVAVGNEADVDLLDVVEWSLTRSDCRLIGLVVEAIRDGERFRRLAEEAVESGRRLIALKLGHSDVGKKAIFAHSSRLAGSGRAYRALLEQSGVVSVDTPEGLVAAAALLERFPAARRGGVAGVTTTGAGAALLADAAERHEVDLADLGAETIDALRRTQRFTTAFNPIDLGAVGLDRASDVVAAIVDDSSVSCLIVYAHQLLRESARKNLFDAVAVSTRADVPTVVLAPGGLSPLELGWYRDADIPVLEDTDSCFQGLRALAGKQFPEASARPDRPRRPVAAVPDILARGDSIAPADAEQLLRAYGIPLIRTIAVASADAAAMAVGDDPGPFVVKGVASGLAHKSDFGLVEVDVAATAVPESCGAVAGRAAQAGIEVESFQLQAYVRGFEALAGVHVEDGFGPMLLAGLGGVFAEELDDVTLWVLPASRNTIKERLATSRLGRVLQSPRQAQSRAFDAFVAVLVGLQELALACGPELNAIDLNPVIVGADGIHAVDWFMDVDS